MELFIDSADIAAVQAAVDLGFIEGITITPTFMHRLGIKDVDGTIVELSRMTNQLHIEALGDTCDGVLAEAERLASLPGLAKPPVFKIPVTNAGLKAANRLVRDGHKTNVHLVYTLNQVYLAAASGASYICPLVGRLQDQGHDSFTLIEQAVDLVVRCNYPAKIMVSSIRHPEHVRLSLLAGAHAVTVPWKVLRILAENALTDRGIGQFSIDTQLTTCTVRQLIRPANPIVNERSSVAEAAIEMTKSKLGAVSVVDGNGRVVGVLTDGDLRRAIDHADLAHERVNRLMTRDPKRVTADTILQDAVAFLHRAQVDNLIVVDDLDRPIGILDVQDLLRDGLLT